MPSVRVRALAKINLDLRVLNKRPDGYHELRTIFQTVSLADQLEISYRRGPTRIEVKSDFNIPGNLIVKAADSVLQTAGVTGRVGFVLTKNIPLGGGLGGGSSDAAAVLLALPRLIRRPLPFGKLLELAESLGSDITFFLLGGTAAAIGRGTELFPLPDLPSWNALLVTGGLHVSTPDAYRALGRQLTTSAPVNMMNDFQSALWSVGVARDAGDWEVRNDFETVVFAQYPQLKLIKGKLLRLGARPALMTGSGSTIYGIFPSKSARDRAAVQLRRELPSGQVHAVTLVSRKRYRALWRGQMGISVGDELWQSQRLGRYAK